MQATNKILFAALGLAISSTFGQTFNYDKCAGGTGAALAATDFSKETLFSYVDGGANMNEPTKMAITNDGKIFFTDRISSDFGQTTILAATAKIRLLDPKTKTATVVGTLPVTTKMYEMGISGIALDPAFDTNHFLYVFYTPALAANVDVANKVFRVSRFTFTNNALDMTSEVKVLEIPSQTDVCCHTGGSMQFDGAGNLWITVGNNTENNGYYVIENSPKATGSRDTLSVGDDQGHAANTNDLRGKILRIHPTPDGKYTIPTGNLFPVGTAKTRPEIYTMGHRNAYSLYVDKYPAWPIFAWGDVGPDEGWATEELNLKTGPGNMGWPYFAGQVGNPNYNMVSSKITKNPKAGLVAADYLKDPAHPKNNSKNNTGLVDLPPAQDATFGYIESAAITGPVYHYNGSLNSTVKFPPHFNKMWFQTDWNFGWLKVSSVDSTGKVGAQTSLWTALTTSHPIDMEFGPDGALYVVEYGGQYFKSLAATTKISRIIYKGTCTDPNLSLPSSVVGVLNHQYKLPSFGKNSLLSNLSAGASIDLPSEAKGFSLYNMQGQKVWEYARQDAAQKKVLVPETVQKGILQVIPF